MNKPVNTPVNNLEKIRKSLSRRNRSERLFRWYGRLAIFIGLAAVTVLFTDIVSKGHGAFRIAYLQLEVGYDQDLIGVDNLTDPEQLILGNWQAVPKQALRQQFPDVAGRSDKRKLYGLVSNGSGFDLKDRLLANPLLLGTRETVWVLADDDIDTYYKSWLDG